MPNKSVELTSRKGHKYEVVATMEEEAENQVYLNHTTEPPETIAESDRVQHVAELSFSFLLLAFGLVLEVSGLTPHTRPIPAQMLEDGEYVVSQANNETPNGETVPDMFMILIAIVLPFCVQLGISLRAGKNHVHKTVCVYFCAIGLTAALTNFIKLYVGYLRPIFIQNCEPDSNYEYCTSESDREMRLSFPSGHSSLSFCGLGILSFFLEMRYGITGSRVLVLHKHSGELSMGYRHPVRYRRIISILCYFPMVIAGFISTSRLVDNFHFPADVVGGTLLGASVAWFSHGTWYHSWPSLDSASQ